jgi:5-methylcytosine-specific restriction endonuclease McrBC GTP-binding regulatory subunit McrB
MKNNPYDDYALYHGDEFIIVGNMFEICRKTNMTMERLRTLLTPSYQRRKFTKGFILIKVEDGD